MQGFRITRMILIWSVPLGQKYSFTISANMMISRRGEDKRHEKPGKIGVIPISVLLLAFHNASYTIPFVDVER